MRDLSRGWVWRAALFALGLLTPSVAAAKIDDLQIDWIIPVKEHDQQRDSVDGAITFGAGPVPRRLYVATSDVVASDGKKLLPAGAQLYLMIGERLMVCSQSQFEAPYLGQSNRVCLRDADGDGQLDAYFTRSMGRSFWTGDEMWFAMNNNLPKSMKSLNAVSFEQIENTQAAERPSMHFDFNINSDGSVSSVVTIEGEHNFRLRCQPEQPDVQPDGSTVSSCFVPDLIVQVTDFARDDVTQRKGVLSFPRRDLTVRFDVAPRLLGARLMNGFYLE